MHCVVPDDLFCGDMDQKSDEDDDDSDDEPYENQDESDRSIKARAIATKRNTSITSNCAVVYTNRP